MNILSKDSLRASVMYIEVEVCIILYTHFMGEFIEVEWNNKIEKAKTIFIMIYFVLHEIYCSQNKSKEFEKNFLLIFFFFQKLMRKFVEKINDF